MAALRSSVKIVWCENLMDSHAQTLMNTVNCVGVMGKGVAKDFKKAYPTMFEDYRGRCVQGNVHLGFPYLYKVSDQRWIVNFPTKKHWRDHSQLTWIETGLRHLSEMITSKEWDIESLAMPVPGCTNGGLSWLEVLPLIEQYLGHLSIRVEVYPPKSVH